MNRTKQHLIGMMFTTAGAVVIVAAIFCFVCTLKREGLYCRQNRLEEE